MDPVVQHHIEDSLELVWYVPIIILLFIFTPFLSIEHLWMLYSTRFCRRIFPFVCPDIFFIPLPLRPLDISSLFHFSGLRSTGNISTLRHPVLYLVLRSILEGVPTSPQLWIWLSCHHYPSLFVSSCVFLLSQLYIP